MIVDLKDVLAATLPGVLPTPTVLFGILTTNDDINHVRTEIAGMRGEISSVRKELRAEISSVRTEIACVRTELGAIRAQSHADTLTLRNISTRWTGESAV